MARPWTRQLPISAGSLRSSKALNRDQMPDRVLFRDSETSTATEGYYGVSASRLRRAVCSLPRL